LSKSFNIPLPKVPRPDDDEEKEVMEATSSVWATANPDLDDSADLYKNLIQDTVTADDACQADVLTRIHDSFQKRN